MGQAALERVVEHNSAKNADGKPLFSWRRGINRMSDWSDEEKRSVRGYHRAVARSMDEESAEHVSVFEMKHKLDALPSSVDWRDSGVVSEVKDQGQCGSCWSFATAETVESHYAIATGMLPVLSEQQVLDCTPNVANCGGTGGCGGGTPALGFDHIIFKGGLASEWTYPYLSYWGSTFPGIEANATCNLAFKPPAAKLSGRVKIPRNQYNALLEAVATVGPIAITVDANEWHDYSSGVFDGCNQTSPHLDHNVQLVGYGTDAQAGDYWLVRNSWAPTWGENGYIRLKRTDPAAANSNAVYCGIDEYPEDGTGCWSGPSTVNVCGTCGILFDNAYPIIATEHAAL